MTRVTELLDKGAYEGLYDLLKELKRSADDAKEKAGERGTAVHHALEQYGMFGVVPNVNEQPVEWRGYFRALRQFLEDYDPRFHSSEVRVGSLTHNYAGTYDARVTIAKRQGLLDAKTSKSPYPENFFQLALYDRAAQECGEEPAEFLAVARFAEDGGYEYIEIPADDPLVSNEVLDAALGWYRGLKDMEAWLKDERKRQR